MTFRRRCSAVSAKSRVCHRTRRAARPSVAEPTRTGWSASHEGPTRRAVAAGARSTRVRACWPCGHAAPIKGVEEDHTRPPLRHDPHRPQTTPQLQAHASGRVRRAPPPRVDPRVALPSRRDRRDPGRRRRDRGGARPGARPATAARGSPCGDSGERERGHAADAARLARSLGLVPRRPRRLSGARRPPRRRRAQPPIARDTHPGRPCSLGCAPRGELDSPTDHRTRAPARRSANRASRPSPTA